MKPYMPFLLIAVVVALMGNNNASSQMYGEVESPLRRPLSSATAAPLSHPPIAPSPTYPPHTPQVPAAQYPAPVNTDDYLRSEGTYENPYWQLIHEKANYGAASPETLRRVQQRPPVGPN